MRFSDKLIKKLQGVGFTKAKTNTQYVMEGRKLIREVHNYESKPGNYKVNTEYSSLYKRSFIGKADGKKHHFGRVRNITPKEKKPDKDRWFTPKPFIQNFPEKPLNVISGINEALVQEKNWIEVGELFPDDVSVAFQAEITRTLARRRPVQMFYYKYKAVPNGKNRFRVERYYEGVDSDDDDSTDNYEKTYSITSPDRLVDGADFAWAHVQTLPDAYTEKPNALSFEYGIAWGLFYGAAYHNNDYNECIDKFLIDPVEAVDQELLTRYKASIRREAEDDALFSY